MPGYVIFIRERTSANSIPTQSWRGRALRTYQSSSWRPMIARRIKWRDSID
jgi:hypothetical protein